MVAPVSRPTDTNLLPCSDTLADAGPDGPDSQVHEAVSDTPIGSCSAEYLPGTLGPVGSLVERGARPDN